MVSHWIWPSAQLPLSPFISFPFFLTLNLPNQLGHGLVLGDCRLLYSIKIEAPPLFSASGVL